MSKKDALDEQEMLLKMFNALQRAEHAVSWIYRWQAPRVARGRLRRILVENQRPAVLRRIGDDIYQLDPKGRYFRPLLRYLAEGKREATEVRQAAENILRRWPTKDDK